MEVAACVNHDRLLGLLIWASYCMFLFFAWLVCTTVFMLGSRMSWSLFFRLLCDNKHNFYDPTTLFMSNQARKCSNHNVPPFLIRVGRELALADHLPVLQPTTVLCWRFSVLWPAPPCRSRSRRQIEVYPYSVRNQGPGTRIEIEGKLGLALNMPVCVKTKTKRGQLWI